MKGYSCKCGAIVGLWFCPRLNRYVCSVCLDKEVIALEKKLKHWILKYGKLHRKHYSFSEAG